uniref:Uncharacterized protein n=1 Tax=Opuntia streptacantha TaxID=393608 RepID=A0A7C9CMD9_OPUST
MARVSPTWAILVPVGLLLLSSSGSTVARMPVESSVNKGTVEKEKSTEVVNKEAKSTMENGEMIWKQKGSKEEAVKLENGEIFRKPKDIVNAPNEGCIGPTEVCGPTSPCCGIMNCLFDWSEYRFRCM